MDLKTAFKEVLTESAARGKKMSKKDILRVKVGDKITFVGDSGDFVGDKIKMVVIAGDDGKPVNKDWFYTVEVGGSEDDHQSHDMEDLTADGTFTSWTHDGTYHFEK